MTPGASKLSLADRDDVEGISFPPAVRDPTDSFTDWSVGHQLSLFDRLNKALFEGLRSIGTLGFHDDPDTNRRRDEAAARYLYELRAIARVGLELGAGLNASASSDP